jgi:mono/diheme cytochrome c family protein
VNDAVVRGDLDEARKAAAWIAEHESSDGLPPAAGPYFDALRRVASDVAGAKDIRTASLATARLLAACGECHAALGVRPSLPFKSQPVVGGISGHMLTHERAVELMFHGLVTPSTSMWTTGANLLRTAPLRSSHLPNDAGVTPEIRTHELRVHALAESARYLAEPRARASLYAPIIASCAACHGLHSRLWGPLPPPTIGR